MGEVCNRCPFLPPFICRRQRSAKNKLFARRRSVKPEGRWFSRIPGIKKYPELCSGYFFIAGAGFEPLSFLQIALLFNLYITLLAFLRVAVPEIFSCELKLS